LYFGGAVQEILVIGKSLSIGAMTMTSRYLRFTEFLRPTFRHESIELTSIAEEEWGLCVAIRAKEL
jgi:hypothetical protein